MLLTWQKLVTCGLEPESIPGSVGPTLWLLVGCLLIYTFSGKGWEKWAERMPDEGEGERKTGRERGSLRGRESHQIRAPLVTSVDPETLSSDCRVGVRGFSKLTLEGHNAVPANTPGTPW